MKSWGLEEGRRALEPQWFYFIEVEECGDVNVVISLQWKQVSGFRKDRYGSM
jgi:hypothetical protein